MEKNKKLLVYVAMLFAAAFWGMSFIWSKVILQFWAPVTLILARLLLSSLFLWVVGLIFKQLQSLKPKDFGIMCLLALFQPFLYFFGENTGLTYVSPTIAAVIIATIPLFSPIAAYWFFKERLSVMNFLGIVISVIGVFLVILSRNLVIDVSPQGILFLLLAVVSAIGYSVVVVKLAGRYNVYSITTFQNTIGIFFFLPLFFMFHYQDFRAVPLTSEILIPLFQLAFFASSLAFLFFTYGIQELGVTRANTLANSIPVFTAIFAFLVLGDRLSLINILGILLVIAGVLMAQLRKRLKTKKIQQKL